MSSRNFHVLAPLCLTLGGCIIDLPEAELDGSTGTDVETTGASSSTGPDESTAGEESSGSTGEPVPGGCGEQSVVASHTGEVGTEVWSAGIHEVDDVYVVGALTVEPCAVLRMAPTANLLVRDGGSLTMEGTEDERILVTSEGTTPGGWGMIDFSGGSTAEANRLVGVDMEFGGGGSTETMVWLDNDASVEIRDSTFTGSRGVAIRTDSDSTLRAFEGNVISDNDGAAMRMHPTVVGDLGPGTYGPNGIDGIVVTDGVVTEDAVWSVSDAPYRLSGISVDGGKNSATLELTAGAEIRFAPLGSLRVRGNAALRLIGTEADPVVVQSANPEPAAGDWEQIRIQEGSLNGSNYFEHAQFRHGGESATGMIWVDSGAELSMLSCLVEESAGPGMEVQRYGRLGTFEGNTLTNNVGAAMVISAIAVGDLGPGTYSPNGIDAIAVESATIETDSTWLAHDAPYHLTGTTRLDTRSGSAVLTVNAGTQLLMGRGSSILVDDNGGLRLEGTAEARIRVASSQEPPSAGDWDHISFDATSIEAQNVWSHVDVAHGAGAGGQYAQLWVGSGAALSLEDVTFTESGNGCDVRVDGDGSLSLQGTTAAQCG